MKNQNEQSKNLLTTSTSKIFLFKKLHLINPAFILDFYLFAHHIEMYVIDRTFKLNQKCKTSELAKNVIQWNIAYSKKSWV